MNKCSNMRDYLVSGSGLSYYGVHEEPDPLKRSHNAGSLLIDYNFLFEKPKVHTHLTPFLTIRQTLDLGCICIPPLFTQFSNYSLDEGD